MKKGLFITILSLIIVSTFAQNNPRPSRSRFWLNKYSTFQLKPGDILVYQVDNNGDVYDFIATIKKVTPSIQFSYSMPQKWITGQTTISPAALNTAQVYDNYFTNGSKNLTDKSSVWLSKNNFRDIATDDKVTKMDMGGGLENFSRESTSTEKINYKGKEKIVTIYKVANDSTNKKEVWVLTDINNPLIVKMDLGWKITLKEVR